MILASFCSASELICSQDWAADIYSTFKQFTVKYLMSTFVRTWFLLRNLHLRVS